MFELTYLKATQTWRAFYKCEMHYSPQKGAFPSDYRHEDGPTPEDAIRNAAAACIARRLSDR